MIGFALCHGWSFDRQSLLPLQSLLAQHFPSSEVVAFDLGFTGAPHVPVLSPDRKWIAVGHSYGFCHLMQQDVQWDAAISLSGFTRFCRHREEPDGVPTRAIDVMLANLAKDHRAVVERFHARCGAVGAATETLDTAMLQHHLARLRDVDLPLPACETLALFTSDDAVVPPMLSCACFPASRCVTRQIPGDHLRLLREPEIILPTIEQFIKSRHD
jgi:hypothetical protein